VELIGRYCNHDSLQERFLKPQEECGWSPIVTVAISGKLSPCVISPADENAADDYLHIAMPLRT
jgi:hypothetical protein